MVLADPDVPPDTNLVENKLRPAKLGQRNWLFACPMSLVWGQRS